MSESLKEFEVQELDTVSERKGKKAKKQKTSLIAPIIFTLCGVASWVYVVIENQLNTLKLLLGETFSTNQIFNSNNSELGSVSNSGGLVGDKFVAVGILIAIAAVLLFFTVLGIVGICKLITRIFRRVALKVK